MKKRTKILLYGLIGFFGLSAIWYGRNLREADDTDQRGESHFTEDRTEPDTDAAEVSTTSSKETGTEPGGHFVLSQVSSYAGKPYVTVNDDKQIGQIRPSGWHTVKYNDLIDGNYLYNRCHLIAYALAGENSNEKNLITGTRYLNVEGMLPFEIQVGDYLRATGNHVLYRVTPVFDGDDLVASGVEMEAWSVEDSGKGICFHVYCYNVQPGVEIDYLTGESRRADGQGSGNTESEEQTEEPVAEEYILNTNSKRIHRLTCDSINDMKEKNKKKYTGTIEELKEQGYRPCQRCLAGY